MVTTEYLEGEELEFYQTVKPFLGDTNFFSPIDEKAGLNMTLIDLIPDITQFIIGTGNFNLKTSPVENPFG